MPRKNPVAARTMARVRDDGTTAEIHVRGGRFVFLVDLDLAEQFLEYRWHIHQNNGIESVYSGTRSAYNLVVGAPPPESGMVIHYRNGDRFDLRRENLEFVSRSTLAQVTMHERKLSTRNTSGVTGISITRSGDYFASIRVNGKRKAARFPSLEEAQEWRKNQRRCGGGGDDEPSVDA